MICRPGDVVCASCRDRRHGVAIRRFVARNMNLDVLGTEWDCPFGVPWGFRPPATSLVHAKDDQLAARRTARRKMCDDCRHQVLLEYDAPACRLLTRPGTPVPCRQAYESAMLGLRPLPAGCPMREET